jgi:hypothetical protein
MYPSLNRFSFLSGSALLIHVKSMVFLNGVIYKSATSAGFLFVFLVGPRAIQWMFSIFGLAHFSGAFLSPAIGYWLLKEKRYNAYKLQRFFL